MNNETCQRAVTEKNKWGLGFTLSYQCGRNATHKQDDGLPLCEKHYNKWARKKAKARR